MGTQVHASQFGGDKTITIIGNGHRVELKTFDELPKSAQSQFDYVIVGEDHYSPRFFSYRGAWYDVNEFERVGTYRDFVVLYQWHGIQSNSFFSGVLIQHLTGDDDGFIRVARYSI